MRRVSTARRLLSIGLVALAGSEAAGAASSLEATSNVADGRWLDGRAPIEVILSRPPDPAVERVAIVIGEADWTGLFERRDRVLSYRAGPVRLPAGESRLRVYLVSQPNDWRPIAEWTLRVRTPAGFEKAEFLPKIDLNNKGQVAESHQPSSNAPPRRTFQDFTVGLGLRSQHVRNGTAISTQVNLLGASNRAESLRFALDGQSAPHLDLADYQVGVQGRRGAIGLGHLSFNPHRHLVTGLATRGLSLTTRLSRTDITLAAVNGNSIVGFDNFFGLSSRNNQVALLVVGSELVGSRPGAARLEATVASGSRLPRSGFTQGQITDAERGRGFGLRFTTQDAANRLRLDAGLARSRFGNRGDSLLSQGLTLVPARERTSDAAYVDAGWDVLRGVRVGRTPVSLSAVYRFERVEPLYRSIAAPQAVRADILQNAVEVQGSVGALAVQASQTWSHDNLGKIASLLRTETDVTTASVGMPLGSIGRSAAPRVWLPQLSYTLNRAGQLGGGVPPDGGFATPSQIPDQVNTVQALRSDWTFTRWRVGYSLNHSFQDNRQEGRELADFGTAVHLVSFALTPSPALDLAIDAGVERAVSKEAGRVSRTRRLGTTGNWRFGTLATLTAIVGRTSIRDGGQSRSHVTDVNVQYSHNVALGSHGALRPRAQLFARWTWQSADVLTLLFGTDDRRRNWSVSTGLTLSVF